MRNEKRLCSDPSDAHVLMYIKFPVTVMDLRVVSNECHISQGFRINAAEYFECWRQ